MPDLLSLLLALSSSGKKGDQIDGDERGKKTKKWERTDGECMKDTFRIDGQSCFRSLVPDSINTVCSGISLCFKYGNGLTFVCL